MILPPSFHFSKNIKSTDFTGTRFAQVGIVGDGKRMIKPHLVLGEINTTPSYLSKSACRMAVIKFLEEGEYRASMKSAWVILEYCKAKNIGYKIEENIIKRT